MKSTLTLLALLLVLTGCSRNDPSAAAANVKATGHWTNSLGMAFVRFDQPAIAFCIWETRVQDFAAFVKSTGYIASAGMLSLKGTGWVNENRTWRDPGFEQGLTHPVVGVSWNDANAFCVWLTKKEQSEGLLTANQIYRLPTDEEWSLAVGLPPETGVCPWEKNETHYDRRGKQYRQTRGLADGSRGNLFDGYPWGTVWPPPTNAGNYADDLKVDTFPFTAPVGSFAPNRLGIYDLGGNVWEWCADKVLPDGRERVWRGAAFTHEPSSTYASLYSTTRAFAPESDCRADLGFRIMLSSVDDNLLLPAGKPTN